MKNTLIKIASVTLCGAIISSCCIGFTADAQHDTDLTGNTVKQLSNNDIKDIISSSDADKEETVFIIADANGKEKKVIVNDWLKNSGNKATINDVSTLSDIKNLKNDSSFTEGDNNKKTWQANGEDIYYSGTTDEALPVDVKITYKLDNKEISADQLKGQSGKVSIAFNYTNNAKTTVTVDNKQMEVYVPFAVVSGMILDNKKFTNIAIDNGKIINDGDRCVAVGFALPGLKSNLGVSADELDIPEEVTITADVKDFELDTTLTLATNEIFSTINTDKLSSTDDIKSKIDEINDGTNKLLDGTSKLNDGLKELLEKSKVLNNGAKELNNGAKDLNSGASQLSDGSKTLNSGLAALYNGNNKLNDGAKLLLPGIKDLSNGSNSVNKGATDLLNAYKDPNNNSIDKGIKDLSTNLETLDQSADVLNDGASQLKIGTSKLSIGANALKTQSQPFFTGVSALSNGLNQIDQNSAALVAGAKNTFNALLNSAKDQLNTGLTQYNKVANTDYKIDTLTIENYAQTLDYISSQLADQTAKAQIAQAKSNLDNYNTFYQGVVLYTGSVTQAATQSQQLKTNIPTVTGSIDKLAQGADQLDVGATDLTNGTKALTDGTAQFVAGGNKLSDGSDLFIKNFSTLVAGTKQLKYGVDTLSSKSSDLVTGIAQLAGGSKEAYNGSTDLMNGLATLNNGSAQLYSGTSDLSDGTDLLVDGVSKLFDGSTQLKDGINQFCNEFNSKLAELDIDKLQNIITGLNASITASKNYETFSGISDDMQGKVKFIYKTAEIR